GGTDRSRVPGEFLHDGPSDAPLHYQRFGWELRRRMDKLRAGLRRRWRLRSALRQRGHAFRDGVPGELVPGELPDLPLRGERPGRELRRRLAELRPGWIPFRRLWTEVLSGARLGHDQRERPDD